MSLLPGVLGGAGITIGDHPFGLDNETGRDMFALTMRGVQQTLVVIAVLAVLATTLGVVLGALAGYYGGWVDSALMRFTDVIITIPLILIAAVAGFKYGASGVWTVAVVLGLLLWTSLARLVRAEFLALREREFVDAARVAGASNRRIIFKHILPNTVGTIVVSVTLLMGAGILIEAALGFLGFGIREPDVSLGSIVSKYQGAFRVAAVAVHLARRVHHRHRAVPAVHRRRAARRVRPTAEADPQAQGPRSGEQGGQPERDPGRSEPRKRMTGQPCQTMSATTPSSTIATPTAIVPVCQVTTGRSRSRRGFSR